MNRLALPIAAIAAALIVAGCGTASTTSSSAGSSSTPSPAASVAGDHNPADVTFAQGMIPHHQQAIEMAKLAATRAASAEVKTLATQIQGAQDPEINQMKGWLTAWGAPTTMPGMTGMSGSAMGTGSMPGMMSDADMTMMSGLTGVAFDRQWLTMMTTHHQGAIAMAHTEQVDGRYGPAKTMADNIVRAQTDEITKMAAVLNSLPAEKERRRQSGRAGRGRG